MVVRGNLVGHAWRTYQHSRVLCGVTMADGLVENDFFPEPIITPSTKASEGHDEDISEAEILAQGLTTPEEWETLKKYTLLLFERGRKLAAERGLILADTKYEFGKLNGVIMLMDEIHTPDSSRYFLKEGFTERPQTGERQKQLSKEFVREWLMSNGFMGKAGQVLPEMTDEWINTISSRYIDLYELIIGAPFKPEPMTQDQTTSKIIESLDRIR
jgi:phosphoribosylaminoimidazole-succinocarboxamide synthase